MGCNRLTTQSLVRVRPYVNLLLSSAYRIASLVWMLYIPKKTLDLIAAQGSHFLVQVKRNCNRLCDIIRLHAALARPRSSCETFDKQHGRKVWRRVELFDAQDVKLPKGWQTATCFIKVRRWGLRKGKSFDETSIYMTSKDFYSAYNVGHIIQRHWSVENNLHWMKDVNLGEDDMSWVTPYYAATIAMLNNVAVNLLRRAGQKPTKDNLAMLSNNVPRLSKILGID